jgi:membrane protein required for colicin V production
MMIDIIFVILLVLALIHGYRRGLIVAVFSLVSIIVGLAAAIKLSAVVANHLGDTVKVSDKWLPVISFAIVFIVVVLLIRLGARAIQKLTEALMLGWLNRLGGIILYAVIYITTYSVVLFYANQVRIIKPETIKASVTYSFIRPWGPKAINGIGSLIPYFKDMFTQLEGFFSRIPEKISV